MKNLLYTLLIGLVIVSCQKEDDYGQAPVAVSTDVEATAIDFDFDSLIDRLSSVKQDKNTASTSKEGGAGSYIKLKYGVIGDFYYEFAWDNTQDDSCANSDYALTNLFLVLNTDGHTEVKLTEDGVALLTLETIPAVFYTLDFRNGWQISRAGTEVTATVSNNLFTF